MRQLQRNDVRFFPVGHALVLHRKQRSVTNTTDAIKHLEDRIDKLYDMLTSGAYSQHRRASDIRSLTNTRNQISFIQPKTQPAATYTEPATTPRTAAMLTPRDPLPPDLPTPRDESHQPVIASEGLIAATLAANLGKPLTRSPLPPVRVNRGQSMLPPLHPNPTSPEQPAEHELVVVPRLRITQTTPRTQ